MPVADYKDDILSCFKISVQETWLGGTDGKIGDRTDCLYIAIQEDENWYPNCCILRNWAFDYEAFKGLPFGIECERYGVYVVYPSGRLPSEK